MTSKKRYVAIKKGFVLGFRSPFLVFGRRPVHFSYRKSDTVEEAWRDVGDELAHATTVEGSRIGKTYKPQERKLVIN